MRRVETRICGPGEETQNLSSEYGGAKCRISRANIMEKDIESATRNECGWFYFLESPSQGEGEYQRPIESEGKQAYRTSANWGNSDLTM